MEKQQVTARRDNKNYWDPLFSVTVTISGFIISQLFAVIVLGIYASIRGFSSSDITNIMQSSAWLTLGFSLLVYGFYIWFIKSFLNWTKHTFKDTGLVIPKSLLVTVAYILGGFVVYFVLTFFTSAIVKAVFPSVNLDQKQDIGFDTTTSGITLLPIFLALVIVPPVVEEIVCRGFLYTGLRKKLSIWVAGAITGIIFASAHLLGGASDAPLLWAAAIDTFVLSAVLVYVREKSGSLAGPIGIHMLKNGLAFMMLFILHLA
jgi:membrane protease YdiL (CAAX protease family)